MKAVFTYFFREFIYKNEEKKGTKLIDEIQSDLEKISIFFPQSGNVHCFMYKRRNI